MCIIIGDDVHQFNCHCLIPLDPWKKILTTIFIFSSSIMEGQPEPGEHRQRLPGLQCDRGGHEVGRFLEGTPVQRCPGMINTFFFIFQ